MGTERNDSARWRAGRREEQRELIDSLNAAVAALSVCMDRLHNLIDRVNQLVEDTDGAPAPRRTQVSLGGGPSVLGARERHGLGREHHTESHLHHGEGHEHRGEGYGHRPEDLDPRGESHDRRESDRSGGERPLGDRFGGERLSGDRLGGNRLGDLLGAGRNSEGDPHLGEDRTHDEDPSSPTTRGQDVERVERRSAPDRHSEVDGVDRLSRHRPERRSAGTAELMAVSEMVHLGYSREEIAERLRARWGDEATAILRDALD